VRAFLDRQIDELVHNGPDIVKAVSGLLVGTTVIVVLALRFGLLHYVVAMWVTAVVGLVCLVRAEVRPVGKGLLAAASGTLSLFPVILFGAVFSSLG
jgi:hypothetical protein